MQMADRKAVTSAQMWVETLDLRRAAAKEKEWVALKENWLVYLWEQQSRSWHVGM